MSIKTENSNSIQTSANIRTAGRSARIGKEVSEATLTLLVDEGLDAVTFDRVAQSSGVNRATLYRRWKNRGRLITWVLFEHVTSLVPTPNTGSLEKDCTNFILSLDALFSTSIGPALFQVIGVDAHRDPAIAILSDEFWQQRLAISEVMLSRAIERGEVAQDIDKGFLVDMIFGPYYFYHLRSRKKISRGHAKKIVTSALKGFKG